MDQIFPPTSNADAGVERCSSMQQQSSGSKGKKANVTTKQKLLDSFGLDLNSNPMSEEKPDEPSLVSLPEEVRLQHGASESMAAEQPQVKQCSQTRLAEQDSPAEPHNHYTGDQSESLFDETGHKITQVNCRCLVSESFIKSFRCWK